MSQKKFLSRKARRQIFAQRLFLPFS